MRLKNLYTVATLAAGLTIGAGVGFAQASAPSEAKSVLLVHGAFADGSSWSKVIPTLQEKGLHVVSVQIPLTSLADDVAAVNRAIKLEAGPVLLVGHSYGGVVITEAGNDPKVVGLVYVAAFGPDKGESVLSLSKTGPATPITPEIQPDETGFLKLTDKGINEDFAQDLPERERHILQSTQIPASVNALGAPVTNPAWKNKPSWFIVASADRAIPPQAETAMAQRMGATVTTVNSSHVVMLSHPEAVSKVIVEASQSKASR